MKKAVLLHPLNERGESKIMEDVWHSSLKAWGQHKKTVRIRRGDGRRTREKEHKRTKAEPEIQNKFKKYNTTTKSLILAQDER